MTPTIPATRETIEANCIPEPNTGCWLWTGHVNPQGYGRFGTRHKAHRVSFEVHNGPIPAGHHICHRCDQPGCVNPEHLFAGTRADNMRDASRKGRFYGQGRPERNPQAKLTPTAAAFIRANYIRGHVEFGGRALAKTYGVSPAAISTVVRGKSWDTGLRLATLNGVRK